MTKKKTDTETVELTIQDIGYRGRGVGRDSNQVVFVPGVIEGERVRVRVTHRHKRFSDATLEEVLEPSPQRIVPACPLALRASGEEGAPSYPCVGCAYQHMAYEEEVRMKQRQLESLLKRMAKLDEVPFSDPVGSPLALHYRNKIRLHGGSYQGKRVLGYVGANNHSVLDVPRCLLAHETINTRLAELRGEQEWLQELRRSAEVTFRYTETDGVLDAVRGVKRMSGELTEHSVLGDLTVPAGGFYQVNPAVADLVVTHVRGPLGNSDCGHVLDLYCGVGVFGLAAGLTGKRVWGVDADERAIACALKNVEKILGEREVNHESTQMDANVVFEEGRVEYAVTEMLDAAPLDDTLTIVDPPRTGLDRRVIEALTAKAPRELIYISCAPDTLARDLVPLVASGYQVKEVKLFDMFPRTACFETVVVMGRE